MKRIVPLVLLLLFIVACGRAPDPVAEVQEAVEEVAEVAEEAVEAVAEEAVEAVEAVEEVVEEVVAEEPAAVEEVAEEEAVVEETADTDAADDSASMIEGNPLPIPPLLEYTVNDDGAKVFDLVLQSGTMEFVDGVVSETMGFNGDYLGPTIRVNAGDDVVFNVQNDLDIDTSVHWHGLHVPPEMDGSPHQLVEPGHSWQSYYPILNEASTMWYHPHPHGTSAEQVSYGLAGAYIIDDENSLSLDIPQTYGVDDIPVVIQDRKFEEGQMNAQTRGGLYYGDTMLTNGALEAYMEVPAKQIRLRLINGSLSRIYSIGFADGREFHQIATDGSLVETPVPLTQFYFSGGERIELVVDVSDGEEAVLISYDDPELEDDNSGSFEILRLIPDTGHEMAETDPTPLPEVLNVIERWDESEADVVRPIVLSGDEEIQTEEDLYIVTEHADQENSGPGGININGKVMDMSRIDEVIMLGDVEIWEIVNGRGSHPIHIHDIQFLILDRNGEPPEPYETGWKDTVLVNGNDTVRVMAKFEHYANEEVPFMFHCHILQHEDGGMMGQFIVVDPEASADSGIMRYLMTYSELQSVVPSEYEFQFNSDGLLCPIPGA